MLWISCLLLLVYAVYAYKKYAHIIPGSSFFKRPRLKKGSAGNLSHKQDQGLFKQFKKLSLLAAPGGRRDDSNSYQIGRIYEDAKLYQDAKVEYRKATIPHENVAAAYALCRLLVIDNEWDEVFHVSAKYLQYPHLALAYYHAIRSLEQVPVIGSTLDSSFASHPLSANWCEETHLTDAMRIWPVQSLQINFDLVSKIELLCSRLTIYRLQILARLIIERPSDIFKCIQQLKPPVFSEISSVSDLLVVGQTMDLFFKGRCGLYCLHCQSSVTKYHYYCQECGAIDQWAEVDLGQHALNVEAL